MPPHYITINKAFPSFLSLDDMDCLRPCGCGIGVEGRPSQLVFHECFVYLERQILVSKPLFVWWVLGGFPLHNQYFQPNITINKNELNISLNN